VRQGLGSKIHHILEGGPSPIGVESTIVDLRDPRRPTVLRFGAVAVEAIEKALGTRVVVHERRASSAKVSQIAPGMLARHYSPRTPVVLHERLDPQAVRSAADADEAFVFFRKPAGRCPRNFFWLDARGRLAGAARTLFALLRRLDAREFRRLHVELAPEEGLGQAINDRLRRAAAR
jgi:L-threonylcarbamoyladenylate synthase